MRTTPRIKKAGWLVAAVVVVSLLALLTTACSRDTNAAALVEGYAYDCTWDGVNGVNNNLPGESTLWILSGGGQGSYTGASLHVTYSNGSTADIPGEVMGEGGSVHFVVPGVAGATVSSATANYNATEEQTNCVVTISHVIEGGTTTTTVAEETTTTVGEESSTTTVTEETTTTTKAETTTTVAEETSTTTVTEETTTTTVDEETTTTLGGETTTSTTTLEESSTTTSTIAGETSTTGGGLTTVTGIQTGGGGTADSNRFQWPLALLAGALALGLVWSAVRPAFKRK